MIALSYNNMIACMNNKLNVIACRIQAITTLIFVSRGTLVIYQLQH